MRSLTVPPILMRALFLNASPPAESKSWVALVAGDDAEDALRLPSDLRESLYGEIIWYGPAANEMTDYLTRLEVETSEKRESLMAVRAALTKPLENQMKEWLWAHTGQLWAHLLKESELATMKWNSLDIPRAATVVCLFQTGQHLFPDELIEASQTLVPVVNKALLVTGMPALSGKFAPEL